MATIDREELRRLTYYRDGNLFWRFTDRMMRADSPLGGSLRSGYKRAMFQYKDRPLHRLIWAWHYDSDPECINHIDEDKLNNRIENLEASNPRHNKRHSSTNKLPPCIYTTSSGKYVGRLTIGSRGAFKRYNTKSVSTVEEAVELLKILEETHLGYNK